MAGVGSRSSCWPMQRRQKWRSSQAEGARRRKNPSECLLQEEREVNSYAALMGYLLLVVRGLGLLVLTWSTVVLLGGFVPVLRKKDFWCLMVITLMQTAGVFNVGQIKKFSYNIDRLMLGLVSSLSAMLAPQDTHTPLFMRWRRYVLGAAVLVAALLFLIVLVPLLPLYTSGLYISTAVAMARLAQRDYGEEADGNLKPALDGLYSVALVQGLLFAAGDIYELADKQLAHSVAQKYGSPDSGGRAVALDYIRDTRSVCDEDPSSSWNGSDRRNVITYAVSLAESRSPGNFAAGARILDMLIKQQTAAGYNKDGDPFELLAHRMLMKQLLLPASSGHVIGNLLCALGPRSQYGSEMRVRAARIVAFLATDLHLEQFPQGIQFISSLLQPSPPQDDDDDDDKLPLDTYELDWELDMIDELGERYPSPPLPRRGRNNDVEEEEDHGHRVLMLQGLRILRKLAVHEDNCRVIRRTRGLLSKVMAPVTCDLLHVIDHGAWSNVVEGSLRTMSQLLVVTVPSRETAMEELGRDIKGAVTAMERILVCDECGHSLQSVATELLTRLYLGTSASMDTKSREKFIDMLLDIFFEAKCPIDTEMAYSEETEGEKEKYEAEAEKRVQRGEIAAGALMRLSFEMEGNAMVTLKANVSIVDKLCAVLINIRNNTYGPIAAAVILETLCTDKHNNDESLKNTMIEAMGKVLEEIILCVTHSNNVQAKNETTQVGLSGPELDIENQCGGAKDRENSRGVSSSSGNLLNAKRRDDEALKLFIPVSLSFCVKVWDTFFCADEDLARHLEAIARRGAALGSFPRTLMEMVERYSRRPTSRNLALLKVISKMVISMMKHRGKYTSEDLDSLIEALSRASSSMLDLDSTIVLASCDDRARTLEKMLKYGTEKPTRTLTSLVKEAHELVDKKKAEELSIE